MRDAAIIMLFVIYFFKIFFVRKAVLNDKSLISLIPECWPLFLFSGILGLFPENISMAFLIVTDFLYSLFLLSILMYNRQFGSLICIRDATKITMLPAVKNSIIALLKPVYLLLFFDLPALFSTVLLQKMFQINIRILNNAFYILMIIISIISLIAGYHGAKKTKGTGSKNIAKKIGVFNYEVFKIMESAVIKKNVMPDTKADIKNELKRLKDLKEIRYFGAAKGMNLLVIQVECLQNFVCGASIFGQNITPNINMLIGESLYFPHIFTQIGPGNTSDAEFMLNTSLYPFENAVISKNYCDRKFPSLPRLLKNEGYESVTLHANTITFWNRDKLYPALGFERAYDINFFGKDSDIIGLGPSDEVLYKKTGKLLYEMAEQKKKFYCSIITLTSHHPFVMPPDRKRITLPEAVEKSLAGKYLLSINYADYALGQFIEYLKCNSLLDNTLLVIFGDHYGLHYNTLSKTDSDILRNISGRQYDVIDTFNIPLLIRIPGMTNSKVIYKSGGQVDIMPTICSLLGLSIDEWIVFGQDLLGNDKSLIGIRHLLPAGSFVNDDIFYVHDCGGLTLNFREPVTQKSFPEESTIIEYMELSDQYIKSLPKIVSI